MGPLQAFLAAPRRFVQVGATQVAYRRFGEGPAVIFVHGWPVNGASFRGLVAAMQSHFTCYVPDLPGAGDTPWDPTIQEFFVDQSRVVEGFADALQLDRFALVGFDSGGTMARLVAARCQSRVDAVLLTNTEVPGHIPPLVVRIQRLLAVPGAGWIFGNLLRLRSYRRSNYGFGGLFHDKDLIDGDFAEACVRPLMRTIEAARAAFLCADLSIAERLATIHAEIVAPVLLVWGERDPFFKVDGARAMVGSFGGPARIETIPATKLFVHEEAPAKVAGAAIPFLLEHGAPRRPNARAAH